MQSISRQKILTTILLFILLGAGVYFYNIYGNGLIQKITNIVVDDIPEPIGGDILILVQKLDYTTLGSELFASPLFTSLKDTSLFVNQEEKSKPNPFASFVSSTAQTSTKR